MFCGQLAVDLDLGNAYICAKFADCHLTGKGIRMGNAVIQLLVLAGIAVFLILRLRSVLGTREGFQKPKVPVAQDRPLVTSEIEVIEDDDFDDDITDHVEDGSNAAKALAAMKLVEPGFSVGEFLEGARGAYEMILMSFERGDMDGISPFLASEVYQTFVDAGGEREDQGFTIDAKFVGIREIRLVDALFDEKSREAEITVRVIAELISTVRNAAGEIVAGNPNKIRRQKDTWTFLRQMGESDPNWILVETDE